MSLLTRVQSLGGGRGKEGEREEKERERIDKQTHNHSIPGIE